MAPLDWFSTAAVALQEAGPALAQKAGLLGVPIADLSPGDHVYAWKMGYTYNHHGIVVHTASCEAGCAHDRLECCSIVHFRPPENTIPGQIEICSLSDFAQGREVYKCRYAVPQAEFYLARAGTCSTHVADAVPLNVLRALSLLEVSQQRGNDSAAEVEYDLLQKKQRALVSLVPAWQCLWRAALLLLRACLLATDEPWPLCAAGPDGSCCGRRSCRSFWRSCKCCFCWHHCCRFCWQCWCSCK